MKVGDRATGIAARCWCDPKTEHVELDTRLAEVFARRLEHYIRAVDQAVAFLEAGWTQSGVAQASGIAAKAAGVREVIRELISKAEE